MVAMANIFTKIGSGIMTAEHFILNVFNDVAKVETAINQLPPDTKATLTKIFTDLTAVAETTVPAVEAEFVNIPLDIASFNAIKTFVTDAKNGVKVAEQFFTTLGIKL
jgi:hypothetical protein